MFAAQEIVSFPMLSQQLSRLAGLPVQLLAATDSSNQQLLDTAIDLPLHPQAPCALMALHQSAGRGRRGRLWAGANESHGLSPAFLASIGIRSTLDVQSLNLLPLHVGVAVAETLQQWGCPAQLKWPNDLVVHTDQGLAKLGGILLETRSASGKPEDGLAVVIGMGLNWHSAPQLAQQLTACVTTQASQPSRLPDPLTASAALLAAMARAWQRCVDRSPCDFAAHDALFNRPITVHAKDANGQDTVQHGIAKGLNALGHLGVDLETPPSALGHVAEPGNLASRALQRVWLHSGEVTVRPITVQVQVQRTGGKV